MTTALPSLAQLKPNPQWAKLPLFNRKNWSRVRFGEVVENVNERVEPADAADEIYVGLDDLDSGSLHLRRWGKGSDVTGTKLRFRKGDIIFGRRRAYQRKLVVAEFDGICSAHAMVARAKPAVVLPEFLPFLMMSDRFMKRAVEISVGSLSPTINWTTLKLEEFDLPPLDQQRRIAEILWAVDETREQWQVVTNSSANLHEVTLRNALLQPGADKKEIFLEEICDVQCGYAFKSTEYKPEGVPLVRISNVCEPYVDVSEQIVFLDSKFLKERQDFVISKGDVLVALSGATTGKTGIYNDDAPALLNQRVGRLRYRSDSPVSETLFSQAFFLFRERILRDAYGAAQPNISPKDLRRYSIFVPLNSKQDVLTDQIQSLVAARQSASQHFQATSELFKVIIEAAIGEQHSTS